MLIRQGTLVVFATLLCVIATNSATVAQASERGGPAIWQSGSDRELVENSGPSQGDGDATVDPGQDPRDAFHGHFTDPWNDPRSKEGNGG
jgi:hypothetical protein